MGKNLGAPGNHLARIFLCRHGIHWIHWMTETWGPGVYLVDVYWSSIAESADNNIIRLSCNEKMTSCVIGNISFQRIK